jgi:hypothetical protein
MKGGYGFRLEYIGDWDRGGGGLGIWRSGRDYNGGLEFGGCSAWWVDAYVDGVI